MKKFFLTLITILMLFSVTSCPTDPPSLSDTKDISAYSFKTASNLTLTSDTTGIINGTDITLTVPYGTDVTALAATFTTTGKTVKISETVQASGITVNNFTEPVTYTVTAEDDSTKDYTVTVTLGELEPGVKVAYFTDSLVFNMAYVPGGIPFPVDNGDADTDYDDGESTVNNAFWIGETEVTYELWNTVYSWAVSNDYTFENPGRQGGDFGTEPVGTVQHPVSTINWRDIIVWCNALTEWYNAQKGTSYNCVYTYSDSVLRNSLDTNAEACDNAVADYSGGGFRLPTGDEWEFSARYRGDDTVNTVTGYDTPCFTKGDSASGAYTYHNDVSDVNPANGIVDGKDANDAVAVYYEYWDLEWLKTDITETKAVKSKTANALGLYDMSGNIKEWSFDLIFGDSRRVHGGGWMSWSEDLRVGYQVGRSPGSESSTTGLRLARTSE